MKIYNVGFAFLMFVIVGVQQVWGQINMVGINTSQPTEILDVHGTMRVRDLPLNGATNAFYNGTGQKREAFRAKSFVVANQDGVLGQYAMAKSLSWFYMPPMNIPVDKDDPQAVYNSGTGEFTVDLYTVYLSQFTTSLKTHPDMPDLNVYEANELDYYVVYYDKKVFEDVAVTPEGKLVYKLLDDPEYSYDTFFTIVYRIK